MSKLIPLYEGKISKKKLIELGLSDFEPLRGREKAVGYIFLPKKGFIFILPKIYENQESTDPLTIYRVLKRYNDEFPSLHKGKNSDSTKTIDSSINVILQSDDVKKNSDYLDIILQLFRFNRENRHFIITELNQIRGHHCIDWRRTIRKTNPAILDGKIAYFNPISRKRVVNNTESLLVMFYSILNYLHITYPNLSQRYEPEFNLDIIPYELFEQFIEGGEDCQGLQYLNRIRTRYFSDKALKLLHLCYAFFEKTASMSEGNGHIDYLLASNFNPIFERMVDDLLSDKTLKDDIMTELNKHGRRLDHIYKDKHPLTEELGYFIGDSKYYSDSTDFHIEDVYKQFDYANYLVQALFDLKKQEDVYSPVSDSYLPTINFFIRGGVDVDGDIKPTNNNIINYKPWQYHFEDRLFDRNTQLVLDFSIDLDKLLKAYIEQGLTRRSLSSKVKQIIAKEYRERIEKKFEYKVSTSYLPSIFSYQPLRGKIYLTKQGNLLLTR